MKYVKHVEHVRHVPESILGFMALDPQLVAGREKVEEHVASCEECRQRLNDIRDFDATLAVPETWEAADAAVDDAGELLAYPVRFAEEDAAAAVLLKQYEDPEEIGRFVWDDVPTRAAFCTGGVARRLCTLANGMCERQPRYALALAEAATRIASILPAEAYPRGTVHEVRGEAWKEQANALYRLGRFPDALHALNNAETEYRKLPCVGLGIVAVKYVRAAVLLEQDHFAQAQTLAKQSATLALHLGDSERYVRGRQMEAYVLFLQERYAAAAELFREVPSSGAPRQKQTWEARSSLNVGRCYLEMGRLEDASTLLYRALRLFTELDLTTEVTRTRWAIARLIFLQGHTPEATHAFRAVIREMTAQGALTYAAIAAVQLAEMLAATNRSREIPKLLTGVVRTFTEAGKLTSALTALAYLREATTAGPVEPAVYTYICRFLSRAERQPGLLFAPPV